MRDWGGLVLCPHSICGLTNGQRDGGGFSVAGVVTDGERVSGRFLGVDGDAAAEGRPDAGHGRIELDGFRVRDGVAKLRRVSAADGGRRNVKIHDFKFVAALEFKGLGVFHFFLSLRRGDFFGVTAAILPAAEEDHSNIDDRENERRTRVEQRIAEKATRL